jgi:DNA-directed RNA polymerase specialized sigma24 family protein
VSCQAAGPARDPYGTGACETGQVVTSGGAARTGRHEEEHLRRFVRARDRGDAAAMRLAWEELVVDFHDRMDGLVGATHKGRLDDEEHELALQLALAKFATNLLTTFKGASVGELVNATKRLAHGVCVDVQRASVRRHRHEGPSLDSGWDATGDDGQAPPWDAEEAARLHVRDEERAEAREFIEWALAQLSDDRRRVLELSLHGAQIPEIMRELGISQANAYQLRSRGLKDLKALKERFDA